MPGCEHHIGPVLPNGQRRWQSLERYLNSVSLEPRTDETITDPDFLLAEVQKTRDRGYSEDNEEFMEGMIAIAVPIIDVHGRLVSTLSFHAPTQRLTLKDAEVHLDRLRTGAKDLAQLLV